MTRTDADFQGAFCSGEDYVVRRNGRFLIAELLTPHRVLSTSAHGGGESEFVRYLVNHQSCEATAHTERAALIAELGLVEFHKRVCRELRLPPDEVALMGTAANMNYAAQVRESFEEQTVQAVVTAGVGGNAARAGDPAGWRETGTDWEKILQYTGTINTMLFFNHPLTPAAQARAVVTMTEAKSAALGELAIASRYSDRLATGTGTDQFCIAAPLDKSRKERGSTSPHVKLGELIGRAVIGATKEALRWQNGLEASSTRNIFHALGRFGLTRDRLMAEIAPLLSAQELTLLEKNDKSVFYEPQVAAAAYALATVLDRFRYGTLPAGGAKEALRQQAANMACSLAAKPDRWVDYWNQLPNDGEQDPTALVIQALALGWKTKWT